MPVIQSPSASVPLGIVVLVLIGCLALAVILGGWWAWRLSARAPRKTVGPSSSLPPALLASPSLADVLNALPFPAALVSPDGVPRVVNDQAASVWLMGSSPPRLSPSLVTLARRVAAGGAVETAPVTIAPEGGQPPVRVRAVPLPGRRHSPGKATPDGVLLVGQTGGEAGLNLTRLVAHELRTPLTAIVGHAEILESCSLADEALWRRSRDFIAAETQRLARLVDDLLALSRLEAAAPLLRAVNVRAVVESALARLFDRAEVAGLKLTLDAPPNLPRVRADADRLEQALVNLLDNAIKYTPGGGTVTTRLASEGGYVLVEISDTGPGISPDDLPHLFEPLYRAESARHLPGTGLGLTIVRAILDQHGAPVSVRSTPGQGTAFTFRLPVAR